MKTRTNAGSETTKLTREDALRVNLLELIATEARRKREALAEERLHTRSCNEITRLTNEVKRFEADILKLQSKIALRKAAIDRKTKALEGKKKRMDNKFKSWHSTEDRLAEKMPKIIELGLLEPKPKRTKRALETTAETTEAGGN